jgi:pyruvate/2-oxoglutarate dehydrogenase complex dihydrolipoamide dehydrogenase (E3) component
MNPPYDYDLIVIGAGIAGMVSAMKANGLGRRVAVVEKNRVKWLCLYRINHYDLKGCMNE